MSLRLLLLCTSVALSSNWQFAFSSTFLNTPVLEFRVFLNDSFHNDLSDSSYLHVWDILQNVWFVGFFIGNWLSPLINDRFGRKKGLLVANSCNLIGAILQFFGVSMHQPMLLFAGRIIASVVTAVAFQAMVLYLQESTPTTKRGIASYMSEITFSGAAIVGMMIGTDELLGDNLPLLMAVNVPPCAIAVAFVFFIPETPKFLLLRRDDRKGAEASIRFFHGAEADVDAVVSSIQQEAVADAQSAHSLRDLLDIFTHRFLIKIVVLGCASMQLTCSLWGIIYNSTRFLLDMDVPSSVAKWSSTGIVVCYFVGTFPGAMLVEKVGRRSLLLPCASTNITAIAIFTTCFYFSKDIAIIKYIGVASLLLYGVVYGIGVGAIAWFIAAELSPIRYRSLVQATCYTMNTVICTIFNFAVLPAYEKFGIVTLVAFYVVPSVFCLLLLCGSLPETRGRETHDIVSALKGTVVPSTPSTDKME